MDFEVKKDMRIAPLCRVVGRDAVNMMKCLDEHLVNQVTNELHGLSFVSVIKQWLLSVSVTAILQERFGFWNQSCGEHRSWLVVIMLLKYILLRFC